MLGLMLVVGACGGDKKSSGEAEVTPCETDDDCTGGLMCMDSECTDTSSSAIYSTKSNNITPEKVKREVEKRGQAHIDDVDKSLDME